MGVESATSVRHSKKLLVTPNFGANENVDIIA